MSFVKSFSSGAQFMGSPIKITILLYSSGSPSIWHALINHKLACHYGEIYDVDLGLSLLSIKRLSVSCRLGAQGVKVWVVNTLKEFLTFLSSVTCLLKSVHNLIRCLLFSSSIPTAIA